MPGSTDPLSGRVTKRQVALELGLSPWQTRKLLTRYRWAARPAGNPPTYDARFIDFIRAVRGQPHRPLEPVHLDWLTRYQEDHPT